MRVSATLIVRDESAFIEECLASLEGFVDEIVLVDTGCRDDTLEKARRFPIKLHSFPWCHDFSAARNYAIAQASGQWILYIDADERLEVRDRQLWNERAVRTAVRRLGSCASIRASGGRLMPSFVCFAMIRAFGSMA